MCIRDRSKLDYFISVSSPYPVIATTSELLSTGADCKMTKDVYKRQLQMFDVPQILTNGKGGPDRTSTTMIMYLNNHLFSKNYGMAGAAVSYTHLISEMSSM